jgi:endonuclease YncB( thermonuclease family)
LGELDVNGWLVEEGHAVAYQESSDYRHQEALARQVWIGMEC